MLVRTTSGARRVVVIMPLLAVLAAVTLTAALAYGKQRLRITAEPVLLVATATTIVSLVGSWRGGDTIPSPSAE